MHPPKKIFSNVSPNSAPVDPHRLQQIASPIAATNEHVAPQQLDGVSRSRHAVAQGSATSWVKMRSVTTTTSMMKIRTTTSKDSLALSEMSSTMTWIWKMTSMSLIYRLLTLLAVVGTAGPIAADLKAADPKVADPKAADPNRSPVKTLPQMKQHPRVEVAVAANASG